MLLLLHRCVCYACTKTCNLPKTRIPFNIPTEFFVFYIFFGKCVVKCTYTYRYVSFGAYRWLKAKRNLCQPHFFLQCWMRKIASSVCYLTQDTGNYAIIESDTEQEWTIKRGILFKMSICALRKVYEFSEYFQSINRKTANHFKGSQWTL